MSGLRAMVRVYGVVAIAVALGGVRPASAATITFESIPGFGTPVDGMSIGTQFMAIYGVSFKLSNGDLPVLAKRGGPRTAFAGPPTDTTDDEPSAGQGVGDFFLTDDGVVGLPPIPLIINYAALDQQASGMLLDIDQLEAWTVDAYSGLNATGTLLESQVLTTASTNAADGNVTPFGFDRAIADIASLLITFSGSMGPGGVGFAFDNFSPPSLESFFSCGANNICEEGEGPPTLTQLNDASVPEPATVTTSLIGLGYLAYRRRRHKGARS